MVSLKHNLEVCFSSLENYATMYNRSFQVEILYFCQTLLQAYQPYLEVPAYDDLSINKHNIVAKTQLLAIAHHLQHKNLCKKF